LKKIEFRLSRLQDLKNQENSSEPELSPSGQTTETTPCFPLQCSNDELSEALRQGNERREQLVKALADGHIEIQVKKNEIQACRLQCRSGGPGCQKKDMHHKIMGLKEGVCQIRQAQQQKKAELHELDARQKNLRCQFQAQKEQKNV
jgi:hypothetical protein